MRGTTGSGVLRVPGIPQGPTPSQVHARQSADRPFTPLGGQDTLAYHDVVLVKAIPTPTMMRYRTQLEGWGAIGRIGPGRRSFWHLEFS